MPKLYRIQMQKQSNGKEDSYMPFRKMRTTDADPERGLASAV